MKLIELLKKIEEQKNDNLSELDFMSGNSLNLTAKELRGYEKNLFECDEFKNVVRINYIDFPTYQVDKQSGEPISINREFLGGDVVANTVSTFQIEQDKEINFSRFIDIYNISLFKKFNPLEENKKPGIWVYPTEFDSTDFSSINQIRVIWDPEKLKDALQFMEKPETSKERLLRLFESSLDNMVPNISCDYFINIRCSERSIISPEKNN